MYEVEQKFKLTAPERFLEKLAELGVAWTADVHESDTYFQHPSRDFRVTDEALRIRRRTVTVNDVQESECFITFKGPKLSAETKTRAEQELPILIHTTEGWETLLISLGFQPLPPIRKRRQKAWLVWQNFRVEISYDDVPPLGKWAELEILVTEKSEFSAAEEGIRTLAERLELTQIERKSYLELSVASCRLSENPPSDN